MKLKKYVIIIDAILIAALIFCIQRINSLQYRACDIVEVNADYQRIIGKLEQGMSVSDIKKEFNCDVFFLGENGYSSKLYDAIENGKIVFDYTKDNQILGKIAFKSSSDSFVGLQRQLITICTCVIVGITALLNILFLYLYLKIIRPFRHLKRFAHNIAMGDLDDPLLIQKDNYFGAFTESFDLLREELKAAKQGEIQANISKRELVASLSHDIKTPVATIKALCEILELKLTEEEAIKKVVTINQKADLINDLISNMFHATLEELKALKIEPTECPSTIISDMLKDINLYDKIKFKNELPSCLIYSDKLRLNQVIDNIINNSYKYANTDIDVTFGETKEYLTVTIADHGVGIDPQELALVCEKFYRGENAKEKTGSGLGLYLAKQFMEGMQGSILCENRDGFSVTLTVKKV